MLDIGKELKELRLHKGLTLQDIADLTRINIKYLELLEQNNFTFLPEVYVKSFLKNYIRTVDADERKILEALDNYLRPQKIESDGKLETVEEKSQTKYEQTTPDISNWFLIGKTNLLTKKNVLFLTSAIIFLLIVISLIISNEKIPYEKKIQANNQHMFEEVDENNSQNFGNFARNDSLTLGISANDSVWIQITMDNLKVEEVYLMNGDSKNFKAKNEFQLLIGNAGAISLRLNETTLPFSGVKGSVKRLKVDKSGVQLIKAKNESQKQQ